MSNFSKNFTHELDFDGDNVSVVLKRMKRKDALKLSAYMMEGENGEVKMSFKDQFEMLDVAASMLPKYLVSIGGLSIDGMDVSIDNKELMGIIYEEAYFMSLLSDIISELMQKSFLTGEDAEKKSDKSPESDTADTAISQA